MGCDRLLLGLHFVGLCHLVGESGDIKDQRLGAALVEVGLNADFVGFAYSRHKAVVATEKYDFGTTVCGRCSGQSNRLAGIEAGEYRAVAIGVAEHVAFVDTQDNVTAIARMNAHVEMTGDHAIWPAKIKFILAYCLGLSDGFSGHVVGAFSEIPSMSSDG